MKLDQKVQATQLRKLKEKRISMTKFLELQEKWTKEFRKRLLESLK